MSSNELSNTGEGKGESVGTKINPESEYKPVSPRPKKKSKKLNPLQEFVVRVVAGLVSQALGNYLGLDNFEDVEFGPANSDVGEVPDREVESDKVN